MEWVNRNIGLAISEGSAGVYVVVFGYDGRWPAYVYQAHEVEHVTCESDAEQATPNGTLPR